MGAALLQSLSQLAKTFAAPLPPPIPTAANFL
jgi:hypothetical protein